MQTLWAGRRQEEKGKRNTHQLARLDITLVKKKHSNKLNAKFETTCTDETSDAIFLVVNCFQGFHYNGKPATSLTRQSVTQKLIWYLCSKQRFVVDFIS